MLSRFLATAVVTSWIGLACYGSACLYDYWTGQQGTLVPTPAERTHAWQKLSEKAKLPCDKPVCDCDCTEKSKHCRCAVP